MATENIMMQAVKKGGDRQELHEKIRVHSMAAARVVKEEGKPNDLLDRICADSSFHMDRDEIHSILKPELYIGRAPSQTEEFYPGLCFACFRAFSRCVRRKSRTQRVILERTKKI